MFDGKAFGLEIVEAVRAYVERTLKPIEIKLAVIEDRKPLKGDPGKDALPGEPGKDGLGFDDLTVEHDGERTVILRFARGDLVKEFPVVFPVPIYRDVYRPEKAYVRGDVVTFGGSMWHCNAATEEKPGDGSTAWTLAAKRGRDGRDGAVREGKAKANGAAHA
jgi:integrin beta 3